MLIVMPARGAVDLDQFPITHDVSYGGISKLAHVSNGRTQEERSNIASASAIPDNVRHIDRLR